MEIQFDGCSHVGMKPFYNADNYILLPNERIFVIADGGTDAPGEVASQITVEKISEYFQDKNIESSGIEGLTESIRAANDQIFSISQSDDKYSKITSTVVALRIEPKTIIIAHVGNSRAYRIRNEKIELLTQDNTLLNDYLKVHKLSPIEIESFPHKNVVTRVLGNKADVIVDSDEFEILSKDIIILCSDGLHIMLSKEKICEITLKNRENLKEACRELIKGANMAGGLDNITVIMILFEI